MGFFKKHLRRLKKVVKGVAKIAIKTAPIWTNFIPGGSAVGKVVERVGGFLDKAKQIKNKLPPRMRALVSKGVAVSKLMGHGGRGYGMGPKLRDTAAMSADEEGAFEAQGVTHAGIRGPVQTHWGPKWRGVAHGVSGAMMGGARVRRRSPRRRAPVRRRYRARAARGGRNRFGQFLSRRRRRAA